MCRSEVIRCFLLFITGVEEYVFMVYWIHQFPSAKVLKRRCYTSGRTRRHIHHMRPPNHTSWTKLLPLQICNLSTLYITMSQKTHTKLIPPTIGKKQDKKICCIIILPYRHHHESVHFYVHCRHTFLFFQCTHPCRRKCLSIHTSFPDFIDVASFPCLMLPYFPKKSPH